VSQYANGQLRILLVARDITIGGAERQIALMPRVQNEAQARRLVADSAPSKEMAASHDRNVGASQYKRIYEEEISMRRSGSS
jgi:hypothetical protein